MNPNPETFNQAVRAALSEIMCCEKDDPLLAAFDAEGQLFNFYNHGVDSLNMLDITFSIDKKLGIKTDIESLINEDKPMILKNLYDSIRP